MKKILMVCILVLGSLCAAAITDNELYQQAPSYGYHFVEGTYSTFRTNGHNYKYFMRDDSTSAFLAYCWYGQVYKIRQSADLDSIAHELDSLRLKNDYCMSHPESYVEALPCDTDTLVLPMKTRLDIDDIAGLFKEKRHCTYSIPENKNYNKNY